MSNVNSVMGAMKGTKIVNDTTEVSGEFSAVYVVSDAVFNTLSDSGSGVKGDYITAPGTAVKAGALIRPYSGLSWATIKLTSGQVVLVK